MEIVKFYKKGRIVTVCLNNGEIFKIHYEVLCQIDLRLNQKISEEKKKEILKTEELFSAKEYALRALTRRIHSQKEVEQKLKKKEVSSVIINEVIKFLSDRKYLNDQTYAERFTEERFFRKKFGLNRIKNELKRKGISEVIIKTVFANYHNEEDEIKIASEKAVKKLNYYKKMGKYDEYQIKQKVMAFLVNRGFSFDIAKKTVLKIV